MSNLRFANFTLQMRRLAQTSLLTWLTGCVSVATTDTIPLPQSVLGRPTSHSISLDGCRLSELPSTQGPSDLLVLVAMSGGGKRSSAYSYGVLKGMREIFIPTADRQTS